MRTSENLVTHYFVWICAAVMALMLATILSTTHVYAAEKKISISANQMRIVRIKLRRAKTNLYHIDQLIHDRESDAYAYSHLMPRDEESEPSIYEENLQSTKIHLLKLKEKRAKLAAAIVTVSNNYNIGMTDLQPARGFASELR